MKRIGIVVAMIVMWMSGALAATGCVIVGNGEAKIQAEGKELSAPIRMPNCDGAKVVSGSVSVCFLNEKGQRTCRNLKEGESFDAKQFSASENASSGAFRATLASLFKGDPQARIGQTRDNPPYRGFPYKNVLLPDGDMQIRLQTPKSRQVTTFRLIAVGGSSQVFTVSPEGDRLHIPIGSLSRGTHYSWEASGNDVKIDGRFKLASDSDLAQMSKAISSLREDPNFDSVSRAILIAEIYFENGYAFDAEEVMWSLNSAKAR